jgi:hypothetical protein
MLLLQGQQRVIRILKYDSHMWGGSISGFPEIARTDSVMAHEIVVKPGLA